MFASLFISGLFPLCFKANQNKPLSWNQPELSIPAADQKDRSSANENEPIADPTARLESWTYSLILFFLVLCEVMFPVFLTLLLADITWTAEGAVGFTEKPNSTLYFMKGSTATMKWDYNVEDKEAQLNYIIWRVRNKTSSDDYSLLFEDNKGDVNISTQIPRMYVGRVEKIGRATLVIKNLTYEDTTRYICILDRKVGENLDSPVELVVTGPVSLGVENKFSPIGDSATFTCNAVNVPSQRFTWMIMKGGKMEKIVSGAHYSISSSGTGSSELRITNVSAVDEGYYVCNATINELNKAIGYLQVLQDISVSYESCPNLSYDVRVGRNDLKLCCPVSGYPKPTITWERNGIQLQKSENPLYFISKVTQEDFGNYTCKATDGKSTIPLAISVRDEIANLEVEAIDGTDNEAANLKWTQQTGADYYVVEINGTDILPDELIGKQTSLEVHHHTLVMKNNKEDVPETTVCVKVSALNSVVGVIARTKDPSCKTIVIKKNK